MGLRERKKARTRAAIQDHALRLFAAQGYEQTTVEQIADAAEVSPSTFFRYFPTKEDVVAYDRLDPELFRSFVAQPAELDVLAAFRGALAEVIGRLDAAQGDRERVRAGLILTVPALRARLGENLLGGVTVLADAIAERTGRPAGSDEVLVAAGAVMGALLALYQAGLATGDTDYLAAADRAIAHLQRGVDAFASPAAGKSGRRSPARAGRVGD